MAQGAAEGSLEDTALFRRLARRERVPRVDVRVAKDQRAVAVMLLAAGFGQDLDPPAVAKFIADEYSFWAPLAKEAGMTVR